MKLGKEADWRRAFMKFADTSGKILVGYKDKGHVE